MNAKTVATTKRIEQFRIFLASGMDGMQKAAESYALSIDEDPNAEARFKSEFKGQVPETAWATMAQVGRKQLHPSLMLGCVSNSKQLRVLPFHQQKAFIETGATVELVTPTCVMNARPINLNKEQAEQVFDHGKIRTVKEQRAFQSALRKDPPKKRNPWTIKGNCVHFHCNTMLTKSQLQDILAELV